MSVAVAEVTEAVVVPLTPFVALRVAEAVMTLAVDVLVVAVLGPVAGAVSVVSRGAAVVTVGVAGAVLEACTGVAVGVAADELCLDV